MKAAVLKGPRCFELAGVSPEEPGRGEVLVAFEGCGICSSSFPVWQGRPWFQYPFAPGQPGHEGWGRVAAIGPGVPLAIGARVAALYESAFVTHAVVKAENVVELPPQLDDRPFPGEALGCAMNIFRRSDVRAGHTVAIVGAGFLGALLTQLASAKGARVTAFSRREWARRLALDFGAVQAHPLDAAKGSFDRVIECVGSQAALDLATDLTREGSRLIVAGYHQDGDRRVNMQVWNWRGLDVVNAHEREPRRYLEGIRMAAEAVVAGEMRPWPLLQHRFPLERINEAFELAEKRPDGVVKVLVCV